MVLGLDVSTYPRALAVGMIQIDRVSTSLHRQSGSGLWLVAITRVMLRGIELG